MKNPVGRPRNPANTVLIEALIGRQDGMSRRTAGKIAEILRTHVRAGDVEIVTRGICRRVRAGLERIPVRAARVPGLSDPATLKFLADEVREVLAEFEGQMGVGADDGAPLPERDPAEVPPKVRRSASLAAARAQSAQLATTLMDLRGRIARYRGPGR